jgi:hypothetical protein
LLEAIKRREGGAGARGCPHLQRLAQHNFEAHGMSEAAPNPNEAWRNFTTRSPITACRLRGTDDLKRLYKIVNQKQVEHGERVVGRFFKTEEETQQQFEARCTQTKDAFITTVQVAGENGEVVTGHGEGFFDSQLLPERIVSI